jgi:hypothetical protein
MDLPQSIPHPELDKALADAKERMARMTPEELDAMRKAQRESWVRGQDWGPYNFRWENGVKVYASYEDYCAD